ncbi:MAG: histidine kinase [Rhodocyclales bacterium]|nr:histidine kinase [Rhodocyclales bacterium]
MTEGAFAPLQLRARRIVLIAAVLSAVGLLFSISAPTTFNLMWFVILVVCLGLSFARLRRSDSNAEGLQHEATPPYTLPTAPQDNANAFLSAAGHDLRQPLQAISLYAATLATHALPEASKQLVGGLELAAETLSAQFEEVMAIAKLEAGRIPLDPKPVALGAILASTVAVHLDEAHDKSLHLRHVGSRLRVWADEALLARAVDRLVAHAVFITERGGVLVGCRQRGDEVWLEVRDTSGGIAPELAGEVFKPFSGYGQRLIDRGLGLVLAERIVNQLGGTLSLRPVAGRGNVCTIRLPRLTGNGGPH